MSLLVVVDMIKSTNIKGKNINQAYCIDYIVFYRAKIYRGNTTRHIYCVIDMQQHVAACVK